MAQTRYTVPVKIGIEAGAEFDPEHLRQAVLDGVNAQKAEGRLTNEQDTETDVLALDVGAPEIDQTEPATCPACGSEDINVDQMESDSGGAWREVTCEACGQMWREFFDFTGYEKI